MVEWLHRNQGGGGAERLPAESPGGTLAIFDEAWWGRLGCSNSRCRYMRYRRDTPRIKLQLLLLQLHLVLMLIVNIMVLIHVVTGIHAEPLGYGCKGSGIQTVTA